MKPRTGRQAEPSDKQRPTTGAAALPNDCQRCVKSSCCVPSDIRQLPVGRCCSRARPFQHRAPTELRERLCGDHRRRRRGPTTATLGRVRDRSLVHRVPTAASGDPHIKTRPWNSPVRFFARRARLGARTTKRRRAVASRARPVAPSRPPRGRAASVAPVAPVALIAACLPS